MSSDNPCVLDPEHGELLLYPALFSAEASLWYSQLRKLVPWRREQAMIFGRRRVLPRLTAWCAGAGQRYRYSGICHEPTPWPQPLCTARTAVEKHIGTAFNSALISYYRNGGEYIGWHSDNEASMGAQPCIASLSLGATRRFQLRPRQGGKTLSIELPAGSLLLMRGHSQRHWQHRLPPSSVARGRINISFRHFEPTSP